MEHSQPLFKFKILVDILMFIVALFDAFQSTTIYNVDNFIQIPELEEEMKAHSAGLRRVKSVEHLIQEKEPSTLPEPRRAISAFRSDLKDLRRGSLPLRIIVNNSSGERKTSVFTKASHGMIDKHAITPSAPMERPSFQKAASFRDSSLQKFVFPLKPMSSMDQEDPSKSNNETTIPKTNSPSSPAKHVSFPLRRNNSSSRFKKTPSQSKLLN